MSVRLKLEDIKALHLELTSKCNADCVFCSRRQKVRAYGNHSLTLADLRRLPRDWLAGLCRIHFGGNFGDFCCNAETVEIAAYLRGLNPKVTLEGDSNGSRQPEHWWNSLGNSFRKGGVIFALDGLADTHALHRRGTDYEKIIRNIRAFVGGGGRAFWKFIVFEHNRHQIEAAEETARNIGCRGFSVVASRDYDEMRRKPQDLVSRLKRDLFEAPSAAEEPDGLQAVCKPLQNQSIYIAADGTVHPCCNVHCMYVTEHNRRFRFVLPLVEKYKKEINFKTAPIEDILAGPYFDAVIRRSRTNPYCAGRCRPQRNEIRRKLVLKHTRFE